MMPIVVTIGPEEAVRVVLNELERFAAPRKLICRKERHENLKQVGNIEIFYDVIETGKAAFHFVTYDDIEVAVDVNFTKMDREYLDDLIHAVREDIDKHRAERKLKLH